MTKEYIAVWDPLVRLFHWTLLCSYVIAYYTQEENYELHLQVGYLILGLLALRLAWGFIGTKYARFSNFTYTPMTIYSYAIGFMKSHNQSYIGHNPAGGLMVLMLITCLLIICLSGIALDAAENRSGPFAQAKFFLYTDAIIKLHVSATYVSLALIFVHVSGVMLTSFLHKENLVLAMITGKKRNQPEKQR